ncbi:MAG: hypothetical protein R3A44_33050 [Caldilineaceae bacterium]
MTSLARHLQTHWQQLRGMTYDLLDMLSEPDLIKKLPFAASQDMQYQFFCMLGTQESWLPVLSSGVMETWDCSLTPASEGQPLALAEVKAHFAAADRALFAQLAQLDLLHPVGDGHPPLHQYMVLVEHEAHHQGQLINFIFALDLPIPPSWADKWALHRDE